MSPTLERRLRSMLTAIVIVTCIAISGITAWATRRYELSRERPPSKCAAIVDSVFANNGNAAPDSVVLSALLPHTEHCLDDAVFVEQTIRLMLHLQRVDDARQLLSDARELHAMSPDELEAQGAWIDLTASHIAWGNGDDATANTVRERAMATANELRQRWREWSQPYLILTEADRLSWKRETEPSIDYFALERAEQRRKLNGAFVRSLYDWQPVFYAFVVSLAGLLGLSAGFSGLLDLREMSGLQTSTIADAKPGYVELKGTLEPIVAEDGMPGGAPGERLWFETARKSGMKGSTWQYERSGSKFALRDATGRVIIDPAQMEVYTRHRSSKSGAALGSGSTVREQTLNAGDSVYATGQLSIEPTNDGGTVKMLRIAGNGRRLLVSNLDEGTLSWIAKLWFGIGVSVFALSVVVLAWSFHQRYNVATAPGSVVASRPS